MFPRAIEPLQPSPGNPSELHGTVVDDMWVKATEYVTCAKEIEIEFLLYNCQNQCAL